VSISCAYWPERISSAAKQLARFSLIFMQAHFWHLPLRQASIKKLCWPRHNKPFFSCGRVQRSDGTCWPYGRERTVAARLLLACAPRGLAATSSLRLWPLSLLGLACCTSLSSPLASTCGRRPARWHQEASAPGDGGGAPAGDWWAGHLPRVANAVTRRRITNVMTIVGYEYVHQP
jgi:hypothetical protein